MQQIAQGVRNNFQKLSAQWKELVSQMQITIKAQSGKIRLLEQDVQQQIIRCHQNHTHTHTHGDTGHGASALAKSGRNGSDTSTESLHVLSNGSKSTNGNTTMTTAGGGVADVGHKVQQMQIQHLQSELSPLRGKIAEMEAGQEQRDNNFAEEKAHRGKNIVWVCLLTVLTWATD